MLKILSRLWDFTGNQHHYLVSALIFSFCRSTLGITQLFSIITAVQVLTGTLDLHQGLVRIIILTLICVLGSFGEIGRAHV